MREVRLPRSKAHEGIRISTGQSHRISLEKSSAPEVTNTVAASTDPTIEVFAEDGTSKPVRVVATAKAIKLKAVPKGVSGGTYKWSTSSTKLTLANTTTPVVTVTAGTSASSALDAEALQLEFTPTGAAPLPVVTVQVSVVALAFSRSNAQKYGYDDMDGAVGVEPHLSVKQNDSTVVTVTVGGGLSGSELFFTSDDATVATVTAPSGAGAQFELTVNGRNKTKAATRIRARLTSNTGPILASLKVDVYKQKTLRATVLKAYDSTSASTNLTRASFDVAAAATAINEWFKAPVVSLELTDASTTGAAQDIHYDVNGSGMLELEPTGTTAGERAIQAKFNPVGQRVVIVKALAWIYFLKTAAKAGDTTLELKSVYKAGSVDYIKYLLDGSAYEVGAGATKERITIDSKSGTVITLKSALAHDHAVGEGLLSPLSGLSGNPIYVTEGSKTESKQRETIGHECSHSLLLWKDLEASKNLMHYNLGRTGTELRFKELPRKYDAGNENQWDKVVR